MPELPDVLLYIEALKTRILDQPLEHVRLASPFVVRSVAPPISAIHGRRVRGLRRLGKQIVFELEGGLFLIVHLMIAGRFQWKERGAKIPGKLGLAAFDFPSGTLLLTEAGSKKRASLNLVAGERELAAFNRGALEVLGSTPDSFREALTRENHTLKRSLTDPSLFSGIGNAYSDEILHRARLSPVKMTQSLTPAEIAALHGATQTVLREWIDRFRRETGEGFPEKVTAFRPEMAAHGKYGRPCPTCGAPIQRIVHAANE